MHPDHPVSFRFRGPRGVLLWGLCLVCVPVLRAQAPPAPFTAQQLAQRVDAYYNRLHSLRTAFTESFHGMGIDRKESGTLLLRKPGKMRWTYTAPAGKLFVLDGKYAWFYSPGDAQAERVPASQLDDLRSPLRFLLGRTQLQKELETLTLSADDAGFKLSGTPKGMQNRVEKIVLGVTSDGVIRSMTIEEVDGSQTVFVFSNTQGNVPATDADFTFQPPEGVPVVDTLPPI